MHPMPESAYRPYDLLDGDEAVREFPALTKRHLRTLRETNTIRYSVVRQKAYYRWIDLYEYLDSCVVGGGR
ncbi:MAG: hypothetical protein ACR2G7_13920 [Acidimicrobiales bacterium]